MEKDLSQSSLSIYDNKTTDEVYEINKIYVIRFLKEAGLFELFKNYIKFCVENDIIIDRTAWYKQEKIDRILGRLRFTEYAVNKGLKITDNYTNRKFTLTKLLRIYLVRKYGRIFNFAFPWLLDNDIANKYIDSNNNLIKLTFIK